jgi:hypothetical protein
MKRAGNYGYSPEQLARINERRQAKGRDILVDKKFDDPDYEKRYIGESESYAAKKNKPAMPTTNDGSRNMLLEGDELERAKKFNERFRPSGSMKAEAEDRTKKYKESFSKEGSMAARYGYKSSFPTPISKAVRKAAEKPILQKSWEDINSRGA